MLRAREGGEPVDVTRVERDVGSEGGRTRVARGAEYLADCAFPCQFPGQGMLAAAAAHHQYSHRLEQLTSCVEWR
jgi:hypothetical protein